MKGLMVKLAGLKIEDMLFADGEKLVFGIVGLVVLLALKSTTWGGYQKHPEELLAMATMANAALTTRGWPEEKKSQFRPSTYQATAETMFAESTKVEEPYGPDSYYYSYDKPMTFPIHNRIRIETSFCANRAYPRFDMWPSPIRRRVTK